MGDGRLISNTDLLILIQWRKWVHWVGLMLPWSFYLEYLTTLEMGKCGDKGLCFYYISFIWMVLLVLWQGLTQYIWIHGIILVSQITIRHFWHIICTNALFVLAMIFSRKWVIFQRVFSIKLYHFLIFGYNFKWVEK